MEFTLPMQYGDSYTEDLTEQSIRDVFKNIEKKVHTVYMYIGASICILHQL